MSQYKRFYQPDRSYFFTLVTYQRRHIFANSNNVKHFKMAMNKVKKAYPFSLQAIVILPDHIHCLWKLPEKDGDYSLRWRLIKRYFSMAMDTSINHRREKEVWRRRFWERVIRGEEDWRKHMDYIHYNPVKHGLVASPGSWEHSSFCYWSQRGFYERDWGALEPLALLGVNGGE